MMPSQKRTNKHSHSERIRGLLENGGKTLHRTKRGWMWNQFFLLEEYTGPDIQYVGKVSLMFKEFFSGDASDIVGIFPPSPQLFCILHSNGPNFSFKLNKAHPGPPEASMIIQSYGRNEVV